VHLATNHQNCGRCGHACASSQACCGGRCVSLSTNVNNCGRCGHICQRGAFVATVGCMSGTCKIVACEADWADCNQSYADGCETDTSTTSNCGGCGVVCQGTNATQVSCTSGTCVNTCMDGYGDCDNDPTNGCETNTMTSTEHCGGCGLACAPAHATGTCITGTCHISMCDAGYGDCNNNAFDGCETQLNTTQHCGGCGVQCNPIHATGTCSTGTCEIAACNAGYFDCNGNPADGCECPGTGCCGGQCQTVHMNGTGQNYYDCAALNTYNPTTAMEACNADTNASGSCTDGWTSGSTGNQLTSVCRTAGTGSSGSCVCWAYSGTGTKAGAVGHVSTSSSGCFAPLSTDPTWN
jgi:Stigma-specific protein, Stig1